MPVRRASSRLVSTMSSSRASRLGRTPDPQQGLLQQACALAAHACDSRHEIATQGSGPFSSAARRSHTPIRVRHPKPGSSARLTPFTRLPLNHTSSGTPGERFQYDGNRFDYLTAVIENKTGKSFVNVVVDTFFDPPTTASEIPRRRSRSGSSNAGRGDAWRCPCTLTSSSPMSVSTNSKRWTTAFSPSRGMATGCSSRALRVPAWNCSPSLNRHSS